MVINADGHELVCLEVVMCRVGDMVGSEAACLEGGGGHGHGHQRVCG